MIILLPVYNVTVLMLVIASPHALTSDALRPNAVFSSRCSLASPFMPTIMVVVALMATKMVNPVEVSM